jgi:hypothetical protein
MGAGEITSYGLTAVGLMLVVHAVARTFMTRVSYVPARAMLLKLLAVNPKRAEKLTHAAPGTFLDAVGAAIRAGATATARDPVTIGALTHPAFEAAATTQSERIKRLVERGLFGSVFACTGLAFAVAGGELSMPALACAIAGALGGLFLVRLRAASERALRQARTDCLPEVDKVFVEGRYTE